MSFWKRTAVLGSIILFLFGANLIGPWLFWESYKSDFVASCAYFATGGLIAEFCLLAIWCALGAQSFVFRIPLTTALVIVAACACVVGSQVPDDSMPRSAGIFMIVAGLLLYGFMQVPLWILRVVTQQQIDVPIETGAPNSNPF